MDKPKNFKPKHGELFWITTSKRGDAKKDRCYARVDGDAFMFGTGGGAEHLLAIEAVHTDTPDKLVFTAKAPDPIMAGRITVEKIVDPDYLYPLI